MTKGTQDEDEIITMIPVTIWVGLAKIGGYFAFLNIAVLGLRILHHNLMNKELKEYLKENAYF